MSFASISCCRGPTKADIESAWRPGATAERIGSRGIRPRQELATASMVREGRFVNLVDFERAIVAHTSTF